MKTKFIVSALVIASGLVGVSSVAQGSSAKTREQVRAELAAAKRDGSFPMYIGEEPVINGYPTSSLSRARVRADLAEAKKDGSFPMYIGEELAVENDSHERMLKAALAGSGELNLEPTASGGPRTRQSVMNELLRAQAAGTLPKQPDTGQ